MTITRRCASSHLQLFFISRIFPPVALKCNFAGSKNVSRDGDARQGDLHVREEGTALGAAPESGNLQGKRSPCRLGIFTLGTSPPPRDPFVSGVFQPFLAPPGPVRDRFLSSSAVSSEIRCRVLAPERISRPGRTVAPTRTFTLSRATVFRFARLSSSCPFRCSPPVLPPTPK